MRLGVRDAAKKRMPTKRPMAENDFARTDIKAFKPGSPQPTVSTSYPVGSRCQFRCVSHCYWPSNGSSARCFANAVFFAWPERRFWSIQRRSNLLKSDLSWRTSPSCERAAQDRIVQTLGKDSYNFRADEPAELANGVRYSQSRFDRLVFRNGRVHYG